MSWQGPPGPPQGPPPGQPQGQPWGPPPQGPSQQGPPQQGPPQQGPPQQGPPQQGPPPGWSYPGQPPQGGPPPVYWQQPPPPPPVHPHPEPRSYPLMLRTWDYAWWRPVLGILTLIASGLVIMPLLLIPVLAVAVALQGGAGSYGDRITDALSLTSVTPAAMLYLNLALASLVLVAMGIMRFLHRLRPRWLASVRPGIRWRFLFACFGLSLVALFVSLIVGSFLPGETTGAMGQAAFPTGQLLATAIVILITTPLQALGEEYAFRGYLMQAFGSLTRSRVAAVLITATLFALAHGVQNFPLFFDRFAFGLMAGLTVVLVGGLEAGIALHVMNNLLAFAVAIAYNQLSGTLNVAEASWWQVPVTITQNGVYLVLVVLVARSMGLHTTTRPPVVQAPPQPVH